ncbi:MAG: TetM/TetW/TetO/TetS family tetracycline resistance ribosomal protection protein [Candidatus Delongbacteria bacterium]|nr:TetM/TetW/TetO/TetS family tetracycline resistance ribosomal protection protein [Candidatus Delongbacteria bacterium]
MKKNKFINIGILAHVDAGKTTITERMLELSGRIKTAGSVDKGTSVTDSMEVEKERGISVRSASVSLEWNNTTINIIDTPGHIDFSSEVDRSLLALDCAVLVISAVEGVQAHTENLWSALVKLNIPVLIFINKTDRAGADIDAVTEEIKKELSQNIIVLQDFSETDDISDEITEQISSADDILIEKYLNEENISFSELNTALKKSIHSRILFPVLSGSAKLNEGIKELLDDITTIMPEASAKSNELSGIVYKLEYDAQFGKMASVRLFSGSIRNRDLVTYGSQGKENKVTQIKKSYSGKLETLDILQSGDTAMICGLENVIAGDMIGSDPELLKRIELCKHTGLSDPLLTVKLEPEKDSDLSALVTAVKELSEEDPALNYVWLKDERQLHIKIMGKIQLEILETVFRQRFNLSVSFGDPIVIYKETPTQKGEGYDEYTMPKPCWAVVRFEIEPLERGSGVVYESKVGVDKIAAKYQNEIEATIDEALQQGIYGWQVTDLKITLIGEEDHVIHSRPGDFILATKLAMMNGLINTGCKLLEPVLSFKISAPEESSGKIISSLIAIRAEIGTPENVDGKIVIDGKIPVATSLDYLNTLNSITGGKGKYITHFHGYQEVPLELGKTIPYRGVSPKDRSKYILKHRGAIK